MCASPSEQGLDLRSLPVQASAKFPAKTLDFGLANPSFLSGAQNKFSWRTGGLPPRCLACTMAGLHAKEGEGCSVFHISPFLCISDLFFLPQTPVWKPECMRVCFLQKYSKTYEGLKFPDGGVHTRLFWNQDDQLSLYEQDSHCIARICSYPFLCWLWTDMPKFMFT